MSGFSIVEVETDCRKAFGIKGKGIKLLLDPAGLEYKCRHIERERQKHLMPVHLPFLQSILEEPGSAYSPFGQERVQRHECVIQ